MVKSAMASKSALANERLRLPLSATDRAFFEGAAAIAGKNLRQFVLDAALKAARQAQTEQRQMADTGSNSEVDDLN